MAGMEDVTVKIGNENVTVRVPEGTSDGEIVKKLQAMPEFKDFGKASMVDVYGEAAVNLPSSTGKMLMDTAKAITKPIDTLTNMGGLMIGLAGKAIPDDWTGGPLPQESKYADPVINEYKKNYGSPEGFKRYFASNPIGPITDVSSVLTGGGSALSKMGKVGKLGKVSAIGDAATATGSMMDPINLVAKGVAGIAAPAISKSAALLAKEGVSPTVGQMYGGWANRAEEKLMSLPILGDAIIAARTSANKELTIAAFNRALAPIGKKAGKLDVGNAGIAKVYDTISKEYDRVIPQAELIFTPELLDDISIALKEAEPFLDSTQKKMLHDQTSKLLLDRVPAGDIMTGKPLQISINALRGRANRLMGPKGTLAEEAAGMALVDVIDVVMEELARGNPKIASEIKATNLAYKNYVVVRKAFTKAGDKSDGITPAQLQSAASSETSSLNQRAAGSGVMQDLGNAAAETMGSKIPDSGTAGRVMAGTAFGGAAGYGAGLSLEDMIPAAVLGGAMATPYLPGVRQGAAKALAYRPDIVSQGANLLRRLPPQLGPVLNQSGRYSGLLEELKKEFQNGRN